ncbi:TlyA family RNA methyltransferase [Corticicoccus populi]|uniref:TlyA family RNA methyltransferase n=1 Tax=Corticicoccus populi TaxID=1812821 RepID=A0ABW5WRG2_9STAP
MKKVRIDEYIFNHFNLGTIDEINRIIMAGKVLNNNQPVYKSSEMIKPETADIRFKNVKTFVSRGGLKLKHAIDHFNLNVQGTVVTDIGSSTGGFTDCALQNGAEHVYAVDVGTNQLDYKLRIDDRVTVMEQTNFKHTVRENFKYPPDIFTIDVSFTSVVPILRHIRSLFSHEFEIIALIKPQFESYLEEVEENGIITDLHTHESVVGRVLEECSDLELAPCHFDRSPITGTKGNIEYLLHLKSNTQNNMFNKDDVHSIIFD